MLALVCSAVRATLTDVWVLEDEALVQLILQPVHLAPDNVQQRLVVDQHLGAILLHLFVERARLVHILEVICQPRASLCLCAYPDELWLGQFEQFAEVRHGRRRELDGCLARPKVVPARSKWFARTRRLLGLLRFAFGYGGFGQFGL